MKLINFDKIIKYSIDEAKKLDNTEYKDLVSKYIKVLKRDYKYRNNKNWIWTNNLLLGGGGIVQIKLDNMPKIKNDPIFYILRNIKKVKPNYEELEVLGEGAYGKVYKIKLNDKIYALKEQNILNYYPASVFIHEINLLKKVNKIKPKIAPKYYKSWIYDNNGYILMEYFNCGTLWEYKKKHKLSSGDKNNIKKLIKILHKNKIYHGDLHENNILVECKNKKAVRFYLNDFGISNQNKNLIKNNYQIVNSWDNTKIYKDSILQNRATSDMVRDIISDKIIMNNIISLT